MLSSEVDKWFEVTSSHPLMTSLQIMEGSRVISWLVNEQLSPGLISVFILKASI